LQVQYQIRGSSLDLRGFSFTRSSFMTSGLATDFATWAGWRKRVSDIAHALIKGHTNLQNGAQRMADFVLHTKVSGKLRKGDRAAGHEEPCCTSGHTGTCVDSRAALQ
jgi:hypothetical protein